MWCSDGFSDDGEWIGLKFPKENRIRQARITFDPNLSEEHCISLSKAVIDKVRKGVPPELVRTYQIRLFLKGQEVFSKEVQGNYQRLNIIDFGEEVCADELQIYVTETNGAEEARIFEVRVY